MPGEILVTFCLTLVRGEIAEFIRTLVIENMV
jgi:hypothetical protein